MTIDILLPYDHFDIANLDQICQDLSKQNYQDFRLKILIDPVHKQPAIDTLANHPQIKFDLFEYIIFDIVDLDYSVMYKSEKRLINLFFNPELLLYQQFTKIVNYTTMLQELVKHSNADYINIIDPYTEILPNHLATLTNMEQPVDIVCNNNIVKAYLGYDLYAKNVYMHPSYFNILQSSNQPDQILHNDLNLYTNNQYNNLSPFLMHKSFLDKLLNIEYINGFSKSGLYWQTMFMANYCNYQSNSKTTVVINIDRYIDYYTHNPSKITLEQELSPLFQKYSDLSNNLDLGNALHQNNYDYLNDDYYNNIIEYNYNLEPSKYDNVLVTIGIPFYNKGDSMRACLNSVINQTYKNLEILCINDQSTDNTLDILNEYAQKDARIKIINHEQNMGVSTARNNIIDNATGQYVQMIDGDDALRYDAIEQCLNIFQKHPEIDVVNFTLLICRNNNFFQFCNSLFTEWDLNSASDIELDQVHTCNSFPQILQQLSACGSLFKVDFLRKHNLHFKLDTRSEDILFNFQTHHYQPKFYFLNQTMYYYIVQANSTTTSSFKPRDITMTTLLDDVPELFNHNQQLRQNAFTIYNTSLFGLLGTGVFQTLDFKNMYYIDILIPYAQNVGHKWLPKYQPYAHEFQEQWVSPANMFGLMVVLYTRYLSEQDFKKFLNDFISDNFDYASLLQIQSYLKPKKINKKYPIQANILQKILITHLFKLLFKNSKRQNKFTQLQKKLDQATASHNPKKPIYLNKKTIKLYPKYLIHQGRYQINIRLITFYIQQLFK